MNLDRLKNFALRDNVYFVLLLIKNNSHLYTAKLNFETQGRKRNNLNIPRLIRKYRSFFFSSCISRSSIDPQKRVGIAFDIPVRTYRKICIPSSSPHLRPTISTEAKNEQVCELAEQFTLHSYCNEYISRMKYISRTH